MKMNVDWSYEVKKEITSMKESSGDVLKMKGMMVMTDTEVMLRMIWE